jgi:cytochrome c oxidase subunit 4
MKPNSSTASPSPSLASVSAAPIGAVFAALLALLALSAASSFLPAAPWKTAAGLVIAAAKTGLIALFFMKLRYQRGLVRIFAGAGLFWLGLLAVLLLTDYLMRDRR